MQCRGLDSLSVISVSQILSESMNIRKRKLLRKARPLKHNKGMARVVSIATKLPTPTKNPAAVALGRLGGLKGGHARAAKLTAAERKEIAQRAAKQRWANSKGKSIEALVDQTSGPAKATRLA